MAEEYGYVAPIDHSTGSAVASTVSGAAGGALKGGLKVGLGWLAGAVGVGAAIGLAFFTGGASLLGSGALWAAIGGGAAGAALGLATLPTAATVGALFGGAKGASRASDQVAMERGAAAQLSAQIEASKYQAMAMGQASNDNKYGFPAQGSRFNPAMAQLDASSLTADGRLAGLQLQR